MNLFQEQVAVKIMKPLTKHINGFFCAENLRKLLDKSLIFAKAQVSAFTGGMADYFMMIYITEVFHVHYTYSIAIGGIIGAVVNFTLNKRWTFRSKQSSYKSSGFGQLIKFVLVVCNSILLKSSGTYLFTTFLGTDYKISRLMTDLTVSIAFNFMLQKHWVFKKNPPLPVEITDPFDSTQF